MTHPITPPSPQSDNFQAVINIPPPADDAEPKFCEDPGCTRKVLRPYIYCDKHQDKASTPQQSLPQQVAGDEVELRTQLMDLYRDAHDAEFKAKLFPDQFADKAMPLIAASNKQVELRARIELLVSLETMSWPVLSRQSSPQAALNDGINLYKEECMLRRKELETELAALTNKQEEKS